MTEFSLKHPERTTVLSLYEPDGEGVTLRASNGDVTVDLLMITADGKIALMVGDGEQKKALGFTLKPGSSEVYTF